MEEDESIKITTATGKGNQRYTACPRINTNACPEYLEKATEVIARNFVDDPAMRFMLSDLEESERLKYLPSFIHSLLKASALNKGSFQEANDWSCAAVWMPPGEKIDNPWTLIPSGMIGILFKLGINGCRGSLLHFQSFSHISI